MADNRAMARRPTASLSYLTLLLLCFGRGLLSDEKTLHQRLNKLKEQDQKLKVERRTDRTLHGYVEPESPTPPRPQNLEEDFNSKNFEKLSTRQIEEKLKGLRAYGAQNPSRLIELLSSVDTHALAREVIANILEQIQFPLSETDWNRLWKALLLPQNAGEIRDSAAKVLTLSDLTPKLITNIQEDLDKKELQAAALQILLAFDKPAGVFAKQALKLAATSDDLLQERALRFLANHTHNPDIEKVFSAKLSPPAPLDPVTLKVLAEKKHSTETDAKLVVPLLKKESLKTGDRKKVLKILSRVPGQSDPVSDFYNNLLLKVNEDSLSDILESYMPLAVESGPPLSDKILEVLIGFYLNSSNDLKKMLAIDQMNAFLTVRSPAFSNDLLAKLKDQFRKRLHSESVKERLTTRLGLLQLGEQGNQADDQLLASFFDSKSIKKFSVSKLKTLLDAFLNLDLKQQLELKEAQESLGVVLRQEGLEKYSGMNHFYRAFKGDKSAVEEAVGFLGKFPRMKESLYEFARKNPTSPLYLNAVVLLQEVGPYDDDALKKARQTFLNEKMDKQTIKEINAGGLKRAFELILRNALSSSEVAHRNKALQALKVMGKLPKVVRPFLVEMVVNDPDATNRTEILHLLGDHELTGMAVFPLMEALKDKNETIRENAAKSLGAAGPEGIPALKALKQAMQNDASPKVREAAKAALESLEDHRK